MSWKIEPEVGSYVLVMEAGRNFAFKMRKAGRLTGLSGYYLYVGSAFGPGGVRARIAHHRKIAKRPHWHVDYLRKQLPIREVWYTHDTEKREHEWARLLSAYKGASFPFEGFGATDCACVSHLVYLRYKPSFRNFERRVPSRCRFLAVDQP